jgi:hypothetical protein
VGLDSLREVSPGVIELKTHTPVATLKAIIGWAEEHGYQLPDLEVSKPTLEGIYLQLTRTDDSREYLGAGPASVQVRPEALLARSGGPVLRDRPPACVPRRVSRSPSGGEETAHIAGHTVQSKTYYVDAMIAMSVISVAFVNLAVSLTAARERGTLKRIRGTRLSPWVFIAGRIATALAVTAATGVLVAIVAEIASGVSPRPAYRPPRSP